MRNDARPVGEHSPASPVGGTEEPHSWHSPCPSEGLDKGESVTHARESHIVNREAEPSQPTRQGSGDASRDAKTKAKI